MRSAMSSRPAKQDRGFVRALRVALWLLLALVWSVGAPAVAQTRGSFDHSATAFPLFGQHENVACETCHLRAIFKGTPRECVGCHVQNNPRGALAMPTRHVQTLQSCDSCHDASTFTGARFDHLTVVPGGCSTCHDGIRAPGKSQNHIATNASCDQCHRVSAFAPAGIKSANHIPTAIDAPCSACHTSPDFSVMPTLAAIHANAPSTTSNCAQCHGAAAASFAISAANFAIVGLPSNHIPTSASCEVCHVGAGSSVTSLPVGNGAKFSGSLMSHAGISSNCVSCHVPSGTSANFVGIASIVGMPRTAPVGPDSHIPSGTACESCHLASLPAGMIAASATKLAPGTAFASPAPSGVQIHAGVTSGCTACHESNYVWMGVSAYPISPSVLTAGAQYKGFQTRPLPGSGTYNVADPAHPGSGDCSQCHSGTASFVGQAQPANHIPFSASATCNACHTSTDYAVMPTLAAIHANAPSTTSNCAQCHGAAAASFAIPAANFAIVGLPSNHIPTSASCEVCHVGAGSSVTSLPVGNGAKFSGSLMSHAGINSNCAACHVPAGTSAAFAGISAIVGMPPTSPMGASSHIPSSTTCETCHLATLPAGLMAANATKTAPGTAFATPAPTGAQIHTGITSGCAACHDTSAVWMGVSAYPISPSVITAGAQYKGFQTRPKAAASTYAIADPAHPLGGDCSQCHAGTTAFLGVDKPANHIPYSVSAQCNSCHTGTDYSVMPTLAAIHANAPSTTSNCAQCHGAAAASFAIPAANFAIVGLPSNHIPTSASCEVCHVGAGSSVTSLPVGNGAKFSGSLMSHSGITSNCVSCHVAASTSVNFVGITRLVGMPPTSPMGASSHIPSSTTCETCHLATVPAGLVAANATKTAPGTAFASPAPSGVQIHTGITGSCSSCHDTSAVWMGMSAYPISPSVITSGAQYKGFQTRPKAAASTYAIADPGHPGSGDCSQCHASTTAFTGVDKPSNHIPYATSAQCTACHTSTDYSVMPTLAAIHANAPSTTSNCAQCHGTAAPSFAIPAANFAIVGLPSNHIPTSASCEVCHVGAGSSVTSLPVGNGAKFSGSLMSHSGISSNCVSCHVTSGTPFSFAGITKIVGMPPTSPMGASSHIPSSTTCETCHLATLPAGQIAANATKTAPGTAFATPAPTSVQIHTGITSGCSACHDTSYVWMGMSAYPISPSVITSGAHYTGFQTRPKATASTYAVADAGHPSTGDCSQCHTGTAYFDGAAKPTGHIPTNGSCSTCHIVSGDFSVAGLASTTVLHTGISSNCRACHVAGSGAGPFAGCTTQASCTSPPPLTYQPTVMPLLAGSSPTAPSKSTHIPVGSVACELCHSASTFTTFLMSGNPMKPSTTQGKAMHSAVPAATFLCESCHERPYTWYGVNIVVRDSGHSGSRAAPNDCDNSGCHKVSSSFNNAARLRPVPVRRAAVNGALPRLLPHILIGSDAMTPGRFDHRGVLVGQCSTCHNGQLAKGRPNKHYGARLSCDSCHRTTAWTPAQFTHSGAMAGQCAACHNGVDANGRSGSHFVTVRACDACHRTLGWTPVTYQHLSPAYKSGPGSETCTSCHITNGEIIPRQLRGNPRTRPIPVPTRPGP